MSLEFRLIISGCGILLFILVFALVRTNKLREELSISWFLIAIVMMIIAMADMIIDPIAFKLKISYPPALIFAIFIFFLVLAFLYFSVVISSLKSRVKELTQKIALLEFEMQDKYRKKND